MPTERIIEETAAYTVIEAEEPGVWVSRRVEWKPGSEEFDWRDRLETDIAWLEAEVTGAPAPGTTTSGNAVARLDALIQHMKRVDRGLIRIFRSILDNTRDIAP